MSRFAALVGTQDSHEDRIGYWKMGLSSRFAPALLRNFG